jgi:ABC-type glutathione transport system ATPase component
MTAAPVLRVDGLDISYRTGREDVVAVRDVSFDVGPGEIVGLVGESGSGKTSICNALIGLLPRRASMRARTIAFDGHDLARVDHATMRSLRGRRIALVPQQPMAALTPTTPIGSQLRWYFGDRVDDPELRATLEAFGLGPVLGRRDHLPDQFSGGELQRLIIAIAAFAHRPTLLLADEPTSTLDATVQLQVLRELLDVQERLDLAILFVSHDLGVVAQICDRVGVMYRGSLVECRTVDDLFGSPTHPHTQALIKAKLLLDADDATESGGRGLEGAAVEAAV